MTPASATSISAGTVHLFAHALARRRTRARSTPQCSVRSHHELRVAISFSRSDCHSPARLHRVAIRRLRRLQRRLPIQSP
jgi:hypothetical protein